MVVTEITFNRDRYHEHRDMAQWCNDHFGDGCWGELDAPRYDFTSRYNTRTGRERWSYVWGGQDGQRATGFAFQFRNKDDATLFALRWL